MSRWSLCGYSSAYMLLKGTITVVNTAAAGAATNNVNKKIMLKNSEPFTSYIGGIDNTQMDDVYWCSNDNVFTWNNNTIKISK